MAAEQVRLTTGPWISQLDARFGGEPENFVPNYEQALGHLEGGGQGGSSTLVELAAARVGSSAAQHFDNDWLQGWWPRAQPIEPILRAGLIEAIKKGLAARLPLSAIWVQAARENEFEVGISQSATQITLLIITPPAPVHAGAPPIEPGDVTLVSRREGQIVVSQ